MEKCKTEEWGLDKSFYQGAFCQEQIASQTLLKGDGSQLGDSNPFLFVELNECMKTGHNCSGEQSSLKAKINAPTAYLNTYFFVRELYFDFKDY